MFVGTLSTVPLCGVYMGTTENEYGIKGLKENEVDKE
jgi:hypothetical protein